MTESGRNMDLARCPALAGAQLGCAAGGTGSEPGHRGLPKPLRAATEDRNPQLVPYSAPRCRGLGVPAYFHTCWPSPPGLR